MITSLLKRAKPKLFTIRIAFLLLSIVFGTYAKADEQDDPLAMAPRALMDCQGC